MGNTKKYFKNIEIFRIIFALIIVVYHLFNSFSALYAIYPDSSLYSYLRYNAGEAGHTAVDLFFIISGFLLVMTFNKTLTVIEFLKKKFIRLFPVLFFSFIVCWILHQFHLYGFNKYGNILSLFFLNNIGVTTYKGLPASWFVSVLVAVSTFYFYIMKHFEKKYTDLITCLLIIFSYAFLTHALNNAIDRGLCQFCYVFSFGIMRGLGGIGLGILIANIYNECSASYNNTQVEKIPSFLPSFLPS